MNAITPIEPNALVPRDMDQAIRLAQAMASAKLVPKHLQNDVGTCLMVVEQALRWRMSPFAVAQCTSNIGGKLMFEGKLVAAAVESSGAIEGGFDYDFKGDGNDRKVTISARRTGETNPRQLTVRLGDVKTTNEFWTKQPDQQLVYSSTRAWARRWTPSVILGVYAPEEFGKGADKHTGPTLEGEAVSSPSHEPVLPTTAATPAPARSGPAPQAEAPPPPPPPEQPKRTIGEWLDDFETTLDGVQSDDEMRTLLESRQINAALQALKNGALDRLHEMIETAKERLQARADDAAEAAVEPEMSLP
jgi:hypothetical protein